MAIFAFLKVTGEIPANATDIGKYRAQCITYALHHTVIGFAPDLSKDAGKELIQEFIVRLQDLPWKDDYDHAIEIADMLLMDVVRVLTWTKDREAKKLAERFRSDYEKFHRWSWEQPKG